MHVFHLIQVKDMHLTTFRTDIVLGLLKTTMNTARTGLIPKPKAFGWSSHVKPLLSQTALQPEHVSGAGTRHFLFLIFPALRYRAIYRPGFRCHACLQNRYIVRYIGVNFQPFSIMYMHTIWQVLSKVISYHGTHSGSSRRDRSLLRSHLGLADSQWLQQQCILAASAMSCGLQSRRWHFIWQQTQQQQQQTLHPRMTWTPRLSPNSAVTT